MSMQGVQQGDPLGPLLFALLLQPILKKLQKVDALRLNPVAVVCPSLGTAHTYVDYLLGYGVHIQSDGAYTVEQA